MKSVNGWLSTKIIYKNRLSLQAYLIIQPMRCRYRIKKDRKQCTAFCVLAYIYGFSFTFSHLSAHSEYTIHCLWAVQYANLITYNLPRVALLHASNQCIFGQWPDQVMMLLTSNVDKTCHIVSSLLLSLSIFSTIKNTLFRKKASSDVTTGTSIFQDSLYMEHHTLGQARVKIDCSTVSCWFSSIYRVRKRH